MNVGICRDVGSDGGQLGEPWNAPQSGGFDSDDIVLPPADQALFLRRWCAEQQAGLFLFRIVIFNHRSDSKRGNDR